MVMARSLPCIPSGCSTCCRETTMPITKAEAARLARRTGMAQNDFCVQNDGVLTLLNNAETRACVFLLTDSSDTTLRGCARFTKYGQRAARRTPMSSTRRTKPFSTKTVLIEPNSPLLPRVSIRCCSILRSASCVKDQPTEAPMHPLNMGGVGLPTAPFNHGEHVRPFAVQ